VSDLGAIRERIDWVLKNVPKTVDGRPMAGRSWSSSAKLSSSTLQALRANPKRIDARLGTLARLAWGAQISLVWFETGRGSPYDSDIPAAPPERWRYKAKSPNTERRPPPPLVVRLRADVARHRAAAARFRDERDLLRDQLRASRGRFRHETDDLRDHLRASRELLDAWQELATRQRSFVATLKRAIAKKD
jgi:hypothetical protein